MAGKRYIFAVLAILASLTASAQEITTEQNDTVPQGLLLEIDSLLNLWYAQYYLLPYDDCDQGNNPAVSDSLYAVRLSAIPSVIDFPYNKDVRKAIDTYTAKSRKTTAYMVGMFNQYEDIFVSSLLKYGVPVELKYLPIIESGLRPKAYSRAGAAGMWQFIYSTGRTYGLSINSLIDDRYDVYLASDAAARHLSDLYGIFSDWGLAIAAYNCGAGNVTKAITRSGGKTDFWKIYQYLPRETRNYLPLYIGATYAMNYYREHNICPMKPAVTQMTDTLMIGKNLHFDQIAAFCDLEKDDIKELNPQYLTEVIPGTYRPCVLTLPTRSIRQLLEAGDSLYAFNQDALFPSSRNKMIDDAMTGKQTYITHVIKDGESLSTIARKYHTSVKNIQSWNNMTTDKIRAGKTLKIYNR